MRMKLHKSRSGDQTPNWYNIYVALEEIAAPVTGEAVEVACEIFEQRRALD